MEYFSNTSYIFLPFTYEAQSAFRPMVDALDGSPCFQPVRGETRYLLRYVADKINSEDGANCQCFHYTLTDAGRERCGIGGAERWYETNRHPFRDGNFRFRFRLLAVHLYCFSTSVGVLAFQLSFEDSDPLRISTAQFHLKRVSGELLRLEGETARTTMLRMAQDVTKDLNDRFTLRFFCHANPGRERANLLTYLEVPEQEDYRRELYYLRHCYSDGYLYTDSPELEEKEIYSLAKDTVWGVSSEAAVCLVCPDMGRRAFLQKTFFRNFNAEYLFMYVLLLHQKYVLYTFLTRIGIGTQNDLETLENYRHQLYEFETDFVFACVTEVPQYQILYDRVSEAFALRRMFEDVHDPLISLAEVRREAAEKARKERDDSVDKALLLLSILSFFSALVDSFDFNQSFFGLFLGSTGVRIVQGTCIVLIFAVVILAFRNLASSRRK